MNSILTFGENFGSRVVSADAQDTKIVWKVYHANITLILVESSLPIDDRVYFEKLDRVFDAMVFLFGLDDLISISCVDKFKKEIRVIFVKDFVYFFF